MLRITVFAVRRRSTLQYSDSMMTVWAAGAAGRRALVRRDSFEVLASRAPPPQPGASLPRGDLASAGEAEGRGQGRARGSHHTRAS